MAWPRIAVDVAWARQCGTTTLAPGRRTAGLDPPRGARRPDAIIALNKVIQRRRLL